MSQFFGVRINGIPQGLGSLVSGTASQITSTTNADGSITLSIPSAFVAPGSIAATTTVAGTGFLFSGAQLLDGSVADVTELYRTTNAQTWNLYKTRTDATTNEYLSIFADSNGFHLRTIKGSVGGTQRNLYLGGSGSDNWAIMASDGSLAPNADNTRDFGSTGTRIKAMFGYTGNFTTSVTAPLFRASAATQLTLSTDGTVIATNNANAGYSIVGTAALAWFKASDGTSDTATVKANQVVTTGTTFALQTAGTLANGAAAQSGTLLNAPAAGNPTKWIAINDNGTTRYVPAW